MAQVMLPHTFVNGTVADADAVNANFAALLAETGRHHVPAIPAGHSPISSAVTDQLCADEDGCEIILIRNGLYHVSSRTMQLIVGSIAYWTIGPGSSPSTFVDGDGSPSTPPCWVYRASAGWSTTRASSRRRSMPFGVWPWKVPAAAP
jgi:hypothetical protein